MRTCNDCKEDLPPTAFRLATWKVCRGCELTRSRAYRKTEAYRTTRKKYRESEKGKATAKALNQRQDVMEKKRVYAKSPRGKASQKKYEATDKGKKACRAK